MKTKQTNQKMEHRKQSTTNEVERRYFSSGVELRARAEGKTDRLFGYALRFDSEYPMWDKNIGQFFERVDQNALKNANMSDVRVLFNHDSNQILGRTKSGTARVGVDEVGLWYEVDLPESAVAVREAVLRGDVDQSSWGFSLKEKGDKVEIRDGKLYRTLLEVDTVYDTSPVTFPANPDTSVAKRSLELRVSPTKWDLKYLIEEQAWAMINCNDMVGRLNNWITGFDTGDGLGIGIDEEINAIVDKSKSAKELMLSIIDQFADIIKKVNASENRSDPGDEQEKRNIEIQNTEIEIDIALLERRYKHLKF